MSNIVNYDKVEVHRKELVVLKDLTFNINEGEYIYLIGKVGSGKSSLLKSIYAEVPVTEGVATVFDYNLNTIKKKEIPFLRRSIGYVFQDYQLLPDRSVYYNLDFVLKATGWTNKTERDIRIDEVLNAVGMHHKSYKMPHELSGGEQQRVVIARALLNKPKLILADEPTGNLDPETGEQIIGLLREVSDSGTAVLIATHNHSLLEQFPGRVMRCEDKHLYTE